MFLTLYMNGQEQTCLQLVATVGEQYGSTLDIQIVLILVTIVTVVTVVTVERNKQVCNNLQLFLSSIGMIQDSVGHGSVRCRPLLGITWVRFFRIELKPVRRVSADENLNRFQHKVLYARRKPTLSMGEFVVAQPIANSHSGGVKKGRVCNCCYLPQ